MKKLVLIFALVCLVLAFLVPAVANAAPVQRPVCLQYHTVKTGDTLSSIATQHGTTVAFLQDRNGLSNPNYIRVGTVLCVQIGNQPPPANEIPAPTPTPRPPVCVWVESLRGCYYRI